MKKLVIATIFTLFAFSSANAGKIIKDSIHSTVLGTDVEFNVYVPDGFDKSDETYPVVYLLHGLSDDFTAWAQKGNMQMVADELIGTGEACRMIIVMPNAGGPDVRNTWNGYFNMPGWNYEDFFFSELVPAVEKKYRCVSDKGHRAVMGLSMGGGGSTVYCQRHPDMFSSCYAMSAWLSSDNGSEVGTDNQKKDKLYYVSQAVHDHCALTFVKNADDATKDRLRTVKWFIDCGDDDFLLDINVQFYQLMRDAGIKAEFRVRNGVHNWEYWHYALRTALPYATRNFTR